MKQKEVQKKRSASTCPFFYHRKIRFHLLAFFVFSLYILELRNTRVGSVVWQFIISIFDIPGAI